MKNGYKKKHNPKIIALIVEIILFLGMTIFVSIYHYGFHNDLNMVLMIVLTGIWLFALILTLSLIRYDLIRATRQEGYYTNKDEKKVFMNIYTDKETMICHDLKDEADKERGE